jgi:hypothetical protein
MSNFTTSYPYKTVEMLMGVNVIGKNFMGTVDHFKPIRTDWNEEYADSLIRRSDDALSELVGVDHRTELRQSTKRVEDLLDKAKAELHIFKINVLADFEENVAEEILNQLGYKRYYQDVVDNDDQESLMNLLNNFNNSMTEDLRKLVTSNGISPEQIDKIIGYAPKFQEANLKQEELKNHWNEPSIDARRECQSLYDETIKICKVGRIIFRDNPEMRDRFTFSKVMSKISADRSAKEKEEEREAREDEEEAGA